MAITKHTLFCLILLFSSLSVSSCDKSNDGEDDNTDNPDTNVNTLPKISINDLTLFEGDGETTFRFKAGLSRNAEQVVMVDYTTQDRSAKAGEDFVAASGSIEIPIGMQEAQIDITILTDTLKEPDEDFEVILSNPQNAEIQKGTASGTIRNDDTYLEIPDDGYTSSEGYAGYDLVWSDEFDASSLDLSKWGFDIGFGESGWGNNELQYYTNDPENIYLSNGKLVIEAREESVEGSSYTSSRIKTQGKYEFKFGRVDIRAKLPSGQGIWPALWMLGANINSIGWPACGEIDIMELIGSEPKTVHGTVHWGAQGQGFSNNEGGSYIIEEAFSEKFHVFSIIWKENQVTFYVDDEVYFSITDSQVNGAYPFNNPFFFIFNIAVGGNWPGSPDETTIFPQQMLVDYIRVFQQ